jgi:hypothetical protein
MALVVKDRVQEASTTSGTGTLTFSGAIPGFQTFSSSIGNGNTTFYTIYDSVAQVWEVGIGTVGAGTLARTTVLSNSSGGTSPINLAGNTSSVFCTYPAEKSINYDADGVATIGEVLGYSDTGIIGSFASTVAGYNQVVVQNKSTATNASSNFNVSNDAGTAGSNYAELGINSSTYTGTGSFSIAGASYVASASTDLTIGTYGAYDIHFVTNSNTTDAMTIHDNGGISLGTFGNPGINNIAASKFVPGYSAITSAAGTTVLTADSNYYQNLLGSTTQTYQLPDATLLLVGTTFIFDNNSTGVLTVVDNASGPVETLASGAAGFVYLANNSTVAGTWNRHSFLPVTYDFNATTANFGTATITNATWNGNTIGTSYGGTGLTTFSAANYALYSTSASALVAGTLPVAAGGSGAVTFTANGVLYGNGTSPLGVTAAGTTGQVLIGNTGAAPSWGTVSSSLVSSFQTSLSGLTPSTATTGAVTLAGTLNATSGGTGISSYAVGDLLFANTTTTLDRIPVGTNGYVLTSNGTAPAWAVIPSNVASFQTSLDGLTPSTATTGAVTLAGTLGTSSGGTNLTSFTSGGAVYATSTSALTTGTLPVASGGTGRTTNTAYAVICGGTTAGGVEQSIASVGVAGQVLTSNGAGALPTFEYGSFPSGTRLAFQQTTAPVGWTKDTTAGLDDSIMRIVTGTASSGGSTAFSTFNAQTTVGSTTLSSAQSGLPAHNHSITDPGHVHSASMGTTDGTAGRFDSSSSAQVNTINVNSNVTGISINNNTAADAVLGHNHTITTNIKYYDFIIASKN